MDIKQVPDDVLQKIAGQQGSQQTTQSPNNNTTDIKSVPDDALQRIAAGNLSPDQQSSQPQQVGTDTQSLLTPSSTSSQQFQPSPLDPMQRAMVAFPRTMQGKMKEIQNLGFNPKDISVDQNNNIAIAGKPIDPAVHGLWDFLRDSMGKVADNIPGSLPFIGQIGADLAATTSGVGMAGLMGANAAGSAGGEALREGVANAMTGESMSGGKMALQGILGGATPPVAMGIGKALQGTKQILLNGMAKIAAGGRADKFVTVASQVLRNSDPEHIQFAIDTIRNKGANSILSPDVASEGYANSFMKNNFFGDDISKTVQNMSKTNPQVVRNLYAGVLGLPQKEVETMMEQGPSIYRMNNPNAMAQLTKNLMQGISDPKTGTGLLDQAGKELGQARLDLVKKAGGIDAQGITETNKPLFDRLTNLGMLQPEENGGFSIAKNWAGGLSTGKMQQRIFTDYLNRFARQETLTNTGITQEAIDAATKASAKTSGRNALGDLLAQTGQGGQKVQTYFPDNNMKYSAFAKELNKFDTALSGNEFDAVGKMAPDLQQAIKGLRGVTLNVAKQVGDDNVPQLTQRYSQLADDLGPLKQMVKGGNASDIQSYLTKISEEKDLPIQSQNYSKLNEIMKAKGVNLLSDLNAYSAANLANKLNTDEGKFGLLSKAQGIFDGAWKDDASHKPINDFIKSKVDPYLPSNMKIIDNGKVHVVAKELDKDARSLLKARFISAGVLGAAGLHAGGPLGATAGLVGGFKAQDPRVLQALLRFAAARGQGNAAKAGAVNVGRPLVAAGLHQLNK